MLISLNNPRGREGGREGPAAGGKMQGELQERKTEREEVNEGESNARNQRSYGRRRHGMEKEKWVGNYILFN